MNDTKKTIIGVVGAGRWGPNLLRCFQDSRRSTVLAACDVSEVRRGLLVESYPGLEVTDDAAAIIGHDEIDAVVIATPTDTHLELTRAALQAGKHVLVEKPITTDVDGATELEGLARSRGRVLLVGHVFLYNLAVRALRDIASREEFGALRYMHARRTNFGPVRQDVHAGWDLATHDVSIFVYLKGCSPVEVTASSQAYLQSGIPDVVFATLYFDDDTVAHLHTSWLDPQKVRQVTLVGENQMAIFDDMNLGEPLRVHNKRCRLTDDLTSGC